MLVGLPHRPLLRGKGGPEAGHTPLAFDGGDERRLLPADERARPLPLSLWRSSWAEPKMLHPKKPLARSCLMASLSLWTAFGYSART